jgi:hypothetical protein
MSPASQNRSQHDGLDLFLFTIPQSALLQLGTASVLTLLLAEKATAETLQAIGQASEEVFRGERLPILDFPIDNQEQLG